MLNKIGITYKHEPNDMSLQNTGRDTVSCPSLKVKVKVDQSVVSLCDPMDLYSPWHSAGHNSEVGNHSFFLIFATWDHTQVFCFAGRLFSS